MIKLNQQQFFYFFGFLLFNDENFWIWSLILLKNICLAASSNEISIFVLVFDEV